MLLVPCVGHRLEKDEDTGEEKEITWVYGFTSAPVFGLDQTEGESRRRVSVPLDEPLVARPPENPLMSFDKQNG